MTHQPCVLHWHSDKKSIGAKIWRHGSVVECWKLAIQRNILRKLSPPPTIPKCLIHPLACRCLLNICRGNFWNAINGVSQGNWFSWSSDHDSQAANTIRVLRNNEHIFSLSQLRPWPDLLTSPIGHFSQHISRHRRPSVPWSKWSKVASSYTGPFLHGMFVASSRCVGQSVSIPIAHVHKYLVVH